MNLKTQTKHALMQLIFTEELLGENPFKKRAYENALKNLEAAQVSTPENILSLPGFGKALKALVLDLSQNKTPSLLLEAQTLAPPGLFELAQIKGLGPKRIWVLFKNLDIKNLGELEYALQENRLDRLVGFGEKTILDIKKSLQDIKNQKNFFLYHEAKETFEHLNTLFTQASLCVLGPLGGYANREEIIECLEVALLKENHIKQKLEQALKEPLKENPDQSLETQGPKKIRFLMFQDQKKAPVPPKPLPHLIKLSDLRGAFHNHTKASDGVGTLEDMRQKAISLGLSYLSISDHSQSAFYARGLKPLDLLAQIEAIMRLNEDPLGGRCFLFTGTESDILADGSLDYDKDLLGRLQVVIASVHQRFKQTSEEMTARMIAAAQNPHTTCIGHPTGRLLLSREPATYDMHAFLKAVKEAGCLLELNANPHRLDLSPVHLSMAKEHGILIGIHADAHSPEGLEDLQYGVDMAQKAGLTPYDVFNSRPKEEVLAWLLKRSI